MSIFYTFLSIFNAGSMRLHKIQDLFFMLDNRISHFKIKHNDSASDFLQ